MGADVLSSLVEGVKRADRRAIGRAITLVESTRKEDTKPALELLSALYPFAGRALRLGVSGVPGAGKSTLIDALGLHAIAHGRRVGVLSVDPSSRVSGGSILGDRTRMARLSQAEQAFVRPSPSAGAHGGLALRTREAAVVLAAAGYDFLIIETVGVGQAEVSVSELSDVVLLVLLAGAGDDVQAMKRGILEHADVIAFNKADGANAPFAQAARDELSAALSWVRRTSPPVLALSAIEGSGVSELFDLIMQRFAAAESDGSITRKRREQRLEWFQHSIERALRDRFESSTDGALRQRMTESVARGDILPVLAAHELLADTK
jgi:LAO/AO transport system kinase